MAVGIGSDGGMAGMAGAAGMTGERAGIMRQGRESGGANIVRFGLMPARPKRAAPEMC